MSKLLFDRPPLCVDQELAKIIGLNEAIIIQQIYYWIKTNKEHGRNYVDGATWVYNTIAQWQEQFPFWSQPTIKRTLAAMEKSGLIITGSYNKAKFDRTKWYRINHEKLDSLSWDQNDPMQQINLTKPIPETTQRKKKRKRTIAEHKAVKQAQQDRLDDIEFDMMKRLDNEPLSGEV